MNTATLSTRDFAAIIRDVLPFACTDVVLPAICTVRLECAPAAAMAVATDRYVLGTSVAPATSDQTTDWAVNLTTTDAAALLKRIGRIRKDDESLIRLQRADGGQFEVSRHAWLGAKPDWAVALDPVDLPYPQWRVILESFEPDPVPQIWLNPFWVAKFGNLTPRVPGVDQLRMSFAGPGRAVLVEYGDHFVGLIQSIKPPAMRGVIGVKAS